MIRQHGSIHIDISKIDISNVSEVIDNFAYLTELNLDNDRLISLDDIIHGISFWNRDDEIPTLTEEDLTDEQLARIKEMIDNPSDSLSMGCVSTCVSIIIDLPDIISNLADLTGLDLDEDRLTSLVESIGNFSFMDGQYADKPIDLNKLDLRYNQLSSLPDSIAKLSNLTILNLEENKLTSLPEWIGNFSKLTGLNLRNNQLTTVPGIIENISNLTELYLGENQLSSISSSIDNLSNLTILNLGQNQLISLPDSIGNLTNLTDLYLNENQLTSLPDSIGNLTNLTYLYLNGNQLTSLPDSIKNLTNLYSIDLCDTLVDLSILKDLPDLEDVNFLGVSFLPRRYWTKLNDWKSEWLLDENNAEIRRILLEQVGYEKICDELNAIALDTWREYTLLKIDGVEAVYEYEDEEPSEREPMLLLKMTCPSTAHIHILRVPPEMMTAEDAITWINHGIHPDKFAVQT